MSAHAEFIYRLVDLVEYAENNDLEVASLALNAAVEMIAPSIAQSIYVNMASPSVTVQKRKRPELRVIQGGRGAVASA
ncbi:MAG: hypothetical protein ACK4SS_06055 [Cypionkella sp.]